MKLIRMCFASMLLMTCWPSQEAAAWGLAGFARVEEENPIIKPCAESCFHCPLQNQEVHWESEYTFNPGAVVRNGKVYLFYRAEDDYGVGSGKRTSRLGMAESSDGVHFKRSSTPVIFPDHDDQEPYEWPGGCEDPRIVETEDGSFLMTYSQWNHKTAILGVASSQDLVHWKKHGYAFADADQGKFGRRWSKSGSIVCRLSQDRLIATKVQGKYWMYWGEGQIYAATSEDLIAWEPVLDGSGNPVVILKARPEKFDSALVEAGPPAILTKEGIVLLYNGKNARENGDPSIQPNAYSAGQVLFDAEDPTKVVARTEECFLKPERPFETSGQYRDGTVFIQGLVHFQGQWFLYYGAADSVVGVAKTHQGQ